MFLQQLVTSFQIAFPLFETEIIQNGLLLIVATNLNHIFIVFVILGCRFFGNTPHFY